MVVIGTFEYSVEVEQALALLEQMGIERRSIMTVSMANHEEHFDKTAIRQPNKETLAFEVGMALATASSVIGISYGFVLHWGPIIWGIITALGGFMVGYVLIRVIQSRYFGQLIRKKERLPELLVIIRCHDSRFDDIRKVLWKYQALSVGKADL
ncbi:hypothetical protein [Paenibacillus sp. y28]|uniref:hypothetical protein n=1 Tax=Paenibacillus sp. y28 TaxID=3129110 RepID=UPI0030162F0A